MTNKEKTMAYRLLQFIGENPKGLTLTAIQYYIWVELEGKTIESFFRKSKTWNGPNRDQGRATRGHWCTALYGGQYYRTGLLRQYCKKVGQRWVLETMPGKTETIYKAKRRW